MITKTTFDAANDWLVEQLEQIAEADERGTLVYGSLGDSGMYLDYQGTDFCGEHTIALETCDDLEGDEYTQIQVWSIKDGDKDLTELIALYVEFGGSLDDFAGDNYW